MRNPSRQWGIFCIIALRRRDSRLESLLAWGEIGTGVTATNKNNSWRAYDS